MMNHNGNDFHKKVSHLWDKQEKIVDVAPTKTIDLMTRISRGGYVTTNSTTRAKQENMNTLYTAKPMFFESLSAG